MRIKEMIVQSAARLKQVTDIPQKEAMILLAHHLGKEMSWLMGHGEEDVNVPLAYEQALLRRQKHEPLEYILAQAHFYARDFYVDKRVLIPRPETELLVDHAISLAKSLPKNAHIVEIGCGSGIISIMLALMLEDMKITAVDISEYALAVSRINAKKHGVEEKISFVQSSYLDAISSPIDMVVSNPPYIADDEPLGEGLEYEPSLALYGGRRGDEMLCHIIDLFQERHAGVLLCEMGYDQRMPISGYCALKGLGVQFYKDFAGLDRGFWIKER